MPYIAWVVILSDHNIKKTSFGNFDFWAAQGENCISRLCTNPLGDTPPRTTNTRIGWKTRKYGLKHALHSLYDHFKWSQYQKNNLRKLRFLSYSGWKTAWAGCVPIPWEPPPPPPPPGPNTQIRWKTCKYGLKYALHSLSGHFEWSQYQKNKFRKLWFLSCPGWKTA